MDTPLKRASSTCYLSKKASSFMTDAPAPCGIGSSQSSTYFCEHLDTSLGSVNPSLGTVFSERFFAEEYGIALLEPLGTALPELAPSPKIVDDSKNDLSPLLTSLGSHLAALGSVISDFSSAPIEQQQALQKHFSSVVDKFDYTNMRSPACSTSTQCGKPGLATRQFRPMPMSEKERKGFGECFHRSVTFDSESAVFGMPSAAPSKDGNFKTPRGSRDFGVQNTHDFIRPRVQSDANPEGAEVPSTSQSVEHTQSHSTGSLQKYVSRIAPGHSVYGSKGRPTTFTVLPSHLVGQEVSSVRMRDFVEGIDPRTNTLTDNLDGLVGVMIMINAIIIGISIDIESDGWIVIEYVFTVFFSAEIVAKIYRHGCNGYLAGRDRYWNMFDALIVGAACADCGVTTYMHYSKSGNSVDLGRFTQMLRLGRVARLVRLLKFKFLSELKLMVQGVFDGLRVLFWAVVLFFFFIYCLALAIVVLVGRTHQDNPLVKESLGKVPWAMFTLFMCLAGGGCTASNGTPLPYHLYNQYGVAFMVGYMLTVLFVTIGLFNLIMAIFVDNVTANRRQHRQKELAMDRLRMECLLRRVLHKCSNEQGLIIEECGRITKSCKNGVVIETDVCENIGVSREKFCELLSHPDFEEFLEKADIETCTQQLLRRFVSQTESQLRYMATEQRQMRQVVNEISVRLVEPRARVITTL